ncbi:MAG: molybdopterin-dependent oxidoreductase [Candidatus Bathyarchaeia archaeon]
MPNINPTLPFSYRKLFLFGSVAGALATIGTYITSDFLGLPFPPEAIFAFMVSLVPGSVQSVAVDTLREYAKYSTFIFAAGLYCLLYGVIGAAAGVISKGQLQTRRTQALPVMAGIPTIIGLALMAARASTVYLLSTLFGWVMAITLTVVLNLGYASIFLYEVRIEAARIELAKAEQPRSPASPSRRGFLLKLAIGAAVLVLVGVASKIGASLFSGQPVVGSGTSIPIDNQPVEPEFSDLPPIFQDSRIRDLVISEVTDDRIFYRVDINAVLPQLDFNNWTLKVAGKVNNPLTLTNSSLMALPTKDQYATLECVSNNINPPSALISNAKWTGVPLATVLTNAGLGQGAKYAVFRCADGYTVGVPLDRAMEPGALLAYKMNDAQLPNEHGFPLRAIVPGLYGMMNAKWITEIDLTDTVYMGYWQERGWTNDARISTTSIIYYPPSQTPASATLPIAGVAFAGDRGISKVEVSSDGGKTWNTATLKKPRSPYSWVLWAYAWTPPGKGTYTLMVRATDGNGQLQDPESRQPFPDGATGYQSNAVTVT